MEDEGKSSDSVSQMLQIRLTVTDRTEGSEEADAAYLREDLFGKMRMLLRSSPMKMSAPVSLTATTPISTRRSTPHAAGSEPNSTGDGSG